MQVEIHVVDAARWSHFEALFERRGSPHYCWCTVWRTVASLDKAPTRAEKKAAMKKRITSGTPVGLLGYVDGIPQAWCSVAPRETFRSLGGPQTAGSVWSLVCFFVRRPMRGQGLGGQLLAAAIAYATAAGAAYLEAYPVAPESPSYRFMGFVPQFERAGFRHVQQVGSRRQMMQLKL